MKKIHLDPESLDVLSFATEAKADKPRGTVHARDWTETTFTAGWHDSCYGTCTTKEYDTCWDAGPTVGPSCDYYCTAPTIGCHPETEACA